jgi:hypothetical protein
VGLYDAELGKPVSSGEGHGNESKEFDYIRAPDKIERVGFLWLLIDM